MLAEPVSHEALGALEGGHRGLPLGIVAEHGEEDLGHAEVLGGFHLGHRHEAEPRVLELALQQRGDLLADELIDAVEPFALHHNISTDVSRTRPSTWSSM